MKYGAWILALVCMLLSGCTKPEERVKMVTQEFIGYLKVLDVGGLKTVTTGQFLKDVEDMEALFAGKYTGQGVKKMLTDEVAQRLTTVNIQKINIEGKIATVALASSHDTVTIALEKTDDGAWKVSRMQ